MVRAGLSEAAKEWSDPQGGLAGSKREPCGSLFSIAIADRARARISRQDAPVWLETAYFPYVMGPFGGDKQEGQTVPGMPWLVFFLQSAQALSTVETAALFGHDHPLEGKFCAVIMPPGENCGPAFEIRAYGASAGT